MSGTALDALTETRSRSETPWTVRAFRIEIGRYKYNLSETSRSLGSLRAAPAGPAGAGCAGAKLKGKTSMSRLYDRSFLLAVFSQTGFVLANSLTVHYARWIGFLGGDVRDIGWVLGFGSIVGLLLRPWMGQWIDRLGVHRSCGLGCALFILGALGSIALEDVGWEMMALRSAFVLGAAFVFASSLAYVSQTCPPERRTEAIGVLGAGGFLGMLLGPGLGDLIVEGESRSRGRFTALFLVAAAAAALSVVILFRLRDSAARHRSRRVRLADFFGAALRHWPGTIFFVVAVFGVCMAVPVGFLADYIDSERLVIPGHSAIGLYFLGHAGWGLVVRLASRRVPDRRGRRKVLIAGTLFMGAGMFSFLWVSPERAWLLLVPGVICGTGHALMFHTMMSLSLDPFPLELRGTASALALMVLDLGSIAGAPILGLIASGYGYSVMFSAIGGVCLVAAAVYTAVCVPVWRARRREREGGA
jgi:MFS family permease